MPTSDRGRLGATILDCITLSQVCTISTNCKGRKVVDVGKGSPPLVCLTVLTRRAPMGRAGATRLVERLAARGAGSGRGELGEPSRGQGEGCAILWDVSVEVCNALRRLLLRCVISPGRPCYVSGTRGVCLGRVYVASHGLTKERAVAIGIREETVKGAGRKLFIIV